MKKFDKKDIRNVCIMGHTHKGKTSLGEAMLFVAKKTDRLGKVTDQNTVFDFDSEEKRRECSLSSSLAYLEWMDTKINLLDTPGKSDFRAGVLEATRAADCALIVTSAGSGYDVGAERAVRFARKRGLAKFFAINKCDGKERDFYKTFDSLRQSLGQKFCPVVVPYVVNGEVKSYVNLCSNKAFTYDEKGNATEGEVPEDEKIEEMKEMLMEAVATIDDDLMEKYFDGVELKKEEIIDALTKGVYMGEIYPVYACSAFNLGGVDLLLDALVYSAPRPGRARNEAIHNTEGEHELLDNVEGPLAICFKTVADAFVGKMSYIKMIKGSLKNDTPLYISRTGQTVRIGKILNLVGAKQEEVSEVGEGDIAVITKVNDLLTGDTICNASQPVTLDQIDFPEPSLSMAVIAAKKGDEDKIAAGLRKIMAEDLTVDFKTDDETKEMILSGLGEQHLEIVASKLKAKYGVEITLKVPKVAYRETIRKTCSVQGKHKKQSGGSGQYGDVWIRFEPHEGDDLIFESEVVGGSVPKNYFPAVEKGLREAILKGPLAGYPVVGIKAVLYDGSYHPVDSNDMAFRAAAKLAFKNGMAQANPVILEPISELRVTMPDSNVGDIMGEVTKRRGRVLNMGVGEEPNTQQILAEVPMAEMGDFSVYLKSVTAGRGSFSLKFVRYEDAPAMVAEKVIAEANKEN